MRLIHDTTKSCLFLRAHYSGPVLLTAAGDSPEKTSLDNEIATCRWLRAEKKTLKGTTLYLVVDHGLLATVLAHVEQKRESGLRQTSRDGLK